MRTLLFALLIVSTQCQAQIEIGAGAGIAPFATGKNYNENVSTSATGTSDHEVKRYSNNTGLCYGLSVSYQLSKIKIGLTYSVASLSHDFKGGDTVNTVVPTSFTNSTAGPFYHTDVRVFQGGRSYIAKSAIAYSAFGNYTKLLGNAELYGGFSFGVVSFTQGNSSETSKSVQGTDTFFHYISNYTYYEVKQKGFTAGVQGGINYKIKNDFYLNCQLSANYVSVTYSDFAGKKHASQLYYFPILIGLHYKINFHKKRGK